MPSDAIWVALIAALSPLAVEVIRAHIKRRDAEQTATHEEETRETEQEAARRTVRALKREVRDLKEENREIRAQNYELWQALHSYVQMEADGRLGTRSPEGSV